MNQDILASLKSGFSGFILMTLITYISRIGNTQLASIITGFPIGLMCIYFLKSSQKATFAFDTTLTNLGVFIAYIMYDILHHYKFSNNATLIYSILTWILIAVILYFTHILK